MTAEPVPPTTLFELRFDNDEYYLPLGLFASEASAKDAWRLLKINPDYEGDYQIAPVTLYSDPPDDDAISAMRGEIGEHNEDATAEPFEPEDGDEPSPDADPPPPPISIGQTSLPI